MRDDFEIYRRGVRDPLPRNVRIPLAEGDFDVTLDLQAVLEKTYEVGLSRNRLHYDRPCIPRLSPDDQAWADELIRAAGVQPR